MTQDELISVLGVAARLIAREYCSHVAPHGEENPACYSGFLYEAIRQLETDACVVNPRSSFNTPPKEGK